MKQRGRTMRTKNPQPNAFLVGLVWLLALILLILFAG